MSQYDVNDDMPLRRIRTDEDSGASTPLLDDSRSTPSFSQHSASTIKRLLYTSHFLSAWNSRMFEFGSFLFLASIYRDTLLPASVYALIRSASAVILSSTIGRYVDSRDRLVLVRWSIFGQRIAVALSCILLLVMKTAPNFNSNSIMANSLLAMVIMLACVEKLSTIANTIAIERDWVVIIAETNSEIPLATLNSQMRRIDLFCKLAAPLFIALVDTASSMIAIVVTGGMTALSAGVEYFAIERVFRALPALSEAHTQSESAERAQSLRSHFQQVFSGLGIYFRHRAFLPSFSLALLYLTVLAFGGQMITYLVAVGVSSGVIGVLRGVSAAFELSATWLGPKLMKRIGPIRSGIWFLNWEFMCVTIACMMFWLDRQSPYAIAGSVAAVIASRVGLWGFDLCAQIIVQDEVEAEHRGVFSAQEFAFQSVFEMLSFASTIVFAKPIDFRYPATISAAAVGTAAFLFTLFVRNRRGHLVHLSQCIERKGIFSARAHLIISQEPGDEETTIENESPRSEPL